MTSPGLHQGNNQPGPSDERSVVAQRSEGPAPYGYVRNRSVDPYRKNRWHIANSDGEPVCGRKLGLQGHVQRSEELPKPRYGEEYVCDTCKRAGEAPRRSRRFTRKQAVELHMRAELAAREAAEGAKPEPMIVGTPRDMMASLMGQPDGGIDPEQPVYKVNEGVCGMAWVVINPATCSFARQLKAHADEQRKAGVYSLLVHPHYYGGMEIYRPGFNGQSYERGMAAARAYAEVLRAEGISAISGGRLD